MSRIILQAGHCHRYTGSVGTSAPGGPTEQEVVWDVCQRAARLLDDTGHSPDVILADVPTDRYRGDAFVAVHCDGSNNATARGASVGYRTSEGQQLAHAWKRAYAGLGWSGFRRDNYTAALQGYYGTRRAVSVENRAACIVELGFLTHPGDAAQLRSSEGRQRAALAIRNAIVAVLGGSTTTDTTDEEDDMVRLIELAYMEAGRSIGDSEKDIAKWAFAVLAKPTTKERLGGVNFVRDMLGLETL